MIDLNEIEFNLSNYEDMIGKEYELNIAQAERIELYESLIAGSLIIRAKSRGDYSETKVVPVIKAIIEWLRTIDFYTAPASTRFHGAFPGGLLLHSLTVYNKMIELHQLKSFSSVAIGSSSLVALTHDWCKINKYESYIKNEKNRQTGQWEEKQAYRWNDKYIGLGHGPQSLMMVSQFCTNKSTNLTFDEMAAIRWHMYTYDVTSYDVDDLNKCSNKIPLVLITQFADQMAAGEG